MIVTSRAEAVASSRKVHVNGRDYQIDAYVGSAPKRGTYVAGNEANDDGRPQGFLVHQPPGAITPAHFHEPNQFQVFVDGGGRIGAQTAAPLAVQYANGHTPYGPIVAGEQGVTYFTLRQRWDPGAKYLPANNALLRSGNQRRRIKAGIGTGTESERRARTAATVEVVLPTEADGLGAWMWRLGPGMAARLPEPAAGGGQYLIVAAGTLRAEGRTLDRLSTVFVTPEEAAFEAAAGDDGLDLLVLQYPQLGKELTGPLPRN